MKNEKIKLSVIIPVRNGQKTIRRALLSIVAQDFEELPFEVIIADDRSEDLTLNEVQKFKDYLNIKVVESEYQEHTPGNAMSTGLFYASGEWVTFLDADDEFSTNAFKTAFSHITEDDLWYVCCMGIQIKKENEVKNLWNSDGWLHGKFYNREFLKSHGITFVENRHFEDTDFNMQLLTILYANGYADNLGYSYYPETAYIWHENENSVRHKTQVIDNVEYSYHDIHFDDFMDSYFGRIVNMCIILSTSNEKERLDVTLPFVLSSFLTGYFIYQEMLYRTYFHPYEKNLEVMCSAKKVINMMGFSDEDIITAAIVDPDSYYEIKRQSISPNNFVELQSFFEFVYSLNVDEEEGEGGR
jgi:glycosyltransferase involved in cell wall biosynthesis